MKFKIGDEVTVSPKNLESPYATQNNEIGWWTFHGTVIGLKHHTNSNPPLSPYEVKDENGDIWECDEDELGPLYTADSLLLSCFWCPINDRLIGANSLELPNQPITIKKSLEEQLAEVEEKYNLEIESIRQSYSIRMNAVRIEKPQSKFNILSVAGIGFLVSGGIGAVILAIMSFI